MPTGTFYNGSNAYWLREVGGRQVWAGEHSKWGPPDEYGRVHRVPPEWANVFFGERQGDTITGRFVDLPKGCTQNHGPLSLRVESNDELSVLSGSFGSNLWHRAAPGRFPPRNMSFNPAGFGPDDGVADLTGVWVSNDGGTYYIRHLFAENRLVWLGERPDYFANVYDGVIDGANVSGRWTDVPKGQTEGDGSLSLRISDGRHLERVSHTGGFGGSIWHRVSSKEASFELRTLELKATEDAGGDEPVLWVVFWKIDGETVNFDRLQESMPVVDGAHPISWRRGNLPRGRVLQVYNPSAPSFSRYSTPLRTVLGLPLDAAEELTRIGLIVVAFDHDETPWDNSGGARNVFDHQIRAGLLRYLRSAETADLDAIVRRAAKKADEEIQDNDFWITDSDDYINRASKSWSILDEGTHDFTCEFRGDGAHYVLAGRVTIASRCG